VPAATVSPASEALARLSSALRVDMSNSRSRCLKRAAQACHRQKPVRCRNPVVVDCPIIVGLETNREPSSHASKYQTPIDPKSGAGRLKTGAWSSKLDSASGSEQSPPRVPHQCIPNMPCITSHAKPPRVSKNRRSKNRMMPKSNPRLFESTHTCMDPYAGHTAMACFPSPTAGEHDTRPGTSISLHTLMPDD
jgi:hypothetical protein